MRKFLFFVFAFFLFSGVAFSQEVEDLKVQVLSEAPHDSGAFTQGLLYYDGFFYESTGIYGGSSLRKVNPETGEVLKIEELPSSEFAEGLEKVGDQLFQLTWQNEVLHVYNFDSFQEIKSVTYSGQGWGICYDGNYLIMTDGSANLFFRDPETFQLLDTLPVTLNGSPRNRLNELEYVNGYVYANVWLTDLIVKINPGTGVIEGVIDASNLLTPEESGSADVLNGIAWNPNSQTFYITGKYWPKVFEVNFVPTSSFINYFIFY